LAASIGKTLSSDTAEARLALMERTRGSGATVGGGYFGTDAAGAGSCATGYSALLE
jgi:hypothetical protein